MKLLLKAALRNRKHFSLLISTFLTLFALTVASQLEMFSLGVLSKNGADFFVLFGDKEGSSLRGGEQISFESAKERWEEIAGSQEAPITQENAATFISKHRDLNPLSWAIAKAKTKFSLGNIKAIVIILLCVAVFKAIWLFASRYTTQLLAIRVSRDLRQQYFEHIQSLPMSFYQEHNIGSLSSRVVGDAGQISSSINSCLTNYLQTPFTIVTCLLALFYLSWQLSF